MKSVLMLSIATVLSIFLLSFADIGAQHTSVSTGSLDWPSWGGPNGDFTVNDAGVLRPDRRYALQVVWKKQLGTGYSAIAVRNGLAVTMFSDGTHDYVIGLDAKDGSERWKYKIGPAYLGHYGSQSGPLSTPLLTDRVVIALSPRGSLFALDVDTGQKLWAVDLVTDHQAVAPFWGFTTSPVMHDNLLLVQTGGSKGNAISAFRPASGGLVWSAGSDTVNYQSPRVFRLGDREHLVFQGNHYLFGLAPETGEILWKFAHGGQSGASSTSGHPVAVGEGRYFVKNRGNGGLLIQVQADNETYGVEKVWQTRNIRSTYIYAVHHGGHLFGYNRQILTCIDAESGERSWRSREPGDGLPIVIDGHLVIMTKDGKLAIAQASGEGYTENARLKLFDDIVWSPASFANGRLYARSMSEIACVEIVPEIEASAPAVPLVGMVPDSRFAHFVEQVNRSADKKGLIDPFIAEQKTFPIVEGDSLVHFVYRGQADDVTVTSDLVGRRFDQPMHRIAGTDLFYYSSHLEPDARITYRYTLDLQ
ncbi:MAG: PQQ-binding-like beta-propeller repeat protein, partial [bacterium]|nr:PQQ-binding-like beta-propeller repeat protein [bacterium]